MNLTALARPVDLLWKILESYGIDPEPLFRQMHVDPGLMKDPNARYRIEALTRLYESAAESIADPCFGLKAADHWHPSHLHALGYAWLASSSLRNALARLGRYIRIIDDQAELKITEDTDVLSVGYFDGTDTVKNPWNADIALSVITAMCRANYGEQLDPTGAYLRHDEPPCAGDYFAYFRCPVYFDSPADRLCFSRDAVDKHLVGDNPQLAQLNDQIAVRYLAELDDGNITNRVKAAIVDQMPSGNVTDQAIAELLHMGVRALQRKLKKEGTTFKTLLDATRRELAFQYIQDNRLNLNEISFLLGFAEVSSFSRAFKRWTGEPPSAFRHAGRNQGSSV